MQLDKKLIGHEFKAFSTTVEAGKVKLFCKAIGEEDPIYATRPPPRKPAIAPCRCRRRSCRPSPTTIPSKGGLLAPAQRRYRPDPARRAALRLLRAGPVGDKITCQQKVTDMYDKKGGALWFVVSETSMKDQAGKLVAKGTGITVVRNPDAGKK